MKALLYALTLSFSFSTIYAQNAPIDFEAGGFGDSWTWTVFENVDNPPLEIIPNPVASGINYSLTVAKFTARQNGAPFAGCETLHGAGIGSWTIDSSNAIIRIMVWKDVISDVGIKLVRFDNWSLGEIKIANTLVNQWEQITFDFSSHIGNTYDQMVVFPDFNARSKENVIYFDNIYGVEVLPSNLENISMEDRIKLFPNPVKDNFQLEIPNDLGEPNSLSIYDLEGKERLILRDQNVTGSIDLSDLEPGIYQLRMEFDSYMVRKRLVKN